MGKNKYIKGTVVIPRKDLVVGKTYGGLDFYSVMKKILDSKKSFIISEYRGLEKGIPVFGIGDFSFPFDFAYSSLMFEPLEKKPMTKTSKLIEDAKERLKVLEEIELLEEEFTSTRDEYIEKRRNLEGKLKTLKKKKTE